MLIGFIIFLLVLLLPLFVEKVETNLELFLFTMGLLAAIFLGVLDGHLFLKAAFNPIKITLAVFVAGLLFKWFHSPLQKSILKVSEYMPFRLFIAVTIILLGIIASLITAIISALVMVLIVNSIELERKSQIKFVVLTCFSIGLGAALTPIGEPLSTIAISKLGVDDFYLLRLIGSEVFGAILVFGIIGALVVKKPTNHQSVLNRGESEGYEEILTRTLKIYFFVMGLTFLGSAFQPLIDRYLLTLDSGVLYWVNIISAILDNATLTAAEISPSMEQVTIKAILMGLLISGGMLIPGNIPNIIAASKLQITSKEWALIGVPFGLMTMFVFYFIIL